MRHSSDSPSFNDAGKSHGLSVGLSARFVDEMKNVLSGRKDDAFLFFWV